MICHVLNFESLQYSFMIIIFNAVKILKTCKKRRLPYKSNPIYAPISTSILFINIHCSLLNKT